MSSIDLASLDTQLAQLESRLENLTPFLADVASLVLTASKKTFADQGSPAGPWAQLRPRTVRERYKAGYGPTPILVRTNALLNSLTSVSTGASSVAVGSPLIQAHALNEGIPEDNLAARTFLVLPTNFQSGVLVALAKHTQL